MSDRYYSTGRGGAGNLQHGKPVEHDEQEIPHLTQKVFTTGRGGAGNMATNSDPQVSRTLQDVEDLDLAPIASPTIGRGGYGNVRAGQQASANLFSKAKGLFKKRHSDTPKEESSEAPAAK
ncbi:hypothetical protein B9G98_04270 [Wickerhamiella sorbophila]|uniref:Protein PAR32 n=1 Tax=Wickerhamiella sorbophila TaxID=45607 RepID=A0A2T0FNT7_9ASCO|nr:hypothetical protein B9G98_04270 [Wickerhamiella sorbophila]PRT56650.1 hypothetical protein B9G98_04270 [Wickerhamiella sorbophila]